MINPPVEACIAAKPDQPVTIVPEQTTVVGTFLTQLKLLLGIPEPVIFCKISYLHSCFNLLSSFIFDFILGNICDVTPSDCDTSIFFLFRNS